MGNESDGFNERTLAEWFAREIGIQVGAFPAEEASGTAANRSANPPDPPEATLASASSHRQLLERVASVVCTHGGRLDHVLDRLSSNKTVLQGRAQRPPTSSHEEKSDSIDRGVQVDEAHDPDLTREGRGRYDIGAEIGRGGQARVFRVVDERIGREIAWKELLPSAEGDATSFSTGRLNPRELRFVREARICGRLEHPNIVPVYELGRQDDGSLYYTMRLVRGTTLRQLLRQCRDLPDRMKLLGAFWDACKAMAFAHQKATIHRDLKPSNIMVGELGETVVLDWGLAKVRGGDDPRGCELAGRAQAASLESGDVTEFGSAMGTPAYMSPEQAQGDLTKIDERSDVWGLGAVLYEILTGRPPFEGSIAATTIYRVLNEDPSPIRDLCPEAPEELVAISFKALRKNREERYADARQMADDVSAYMTGQRVHAHDYTSWQLVKRFAARNRAVIVAAALVSVAVVVSLLVVALAYHKEHRERLHAHYHLAQAYARQAERFFEQSDRLNAKVFAAASLNNNPAYAGSPYHTQAFSTREPESDWLGVEAASMLWQPQPGITNLDHSFRMSDAVACSAVSPDGKWVAAGDFSGKLGLWGISDRSNGQLRQAHPKKVRAIAFSPNGRQLATGSKDGLKLWDVVRVEPTGIIAIPEPSLTAIAYSPDSASIVVGDAAGGIRWVDISSSTIIKALRPHSKGVTCLAYSADGRWLASGSLDKSVLLIDPNLALLKSTLVGHTDNVSGVAFSPNGKTLASVGYDKTIRTWDVVHGQPLATVSGGGHIVYSVAYSFDGRALLTANQDRTFRIWDVDDAKLLASHQGHEDTVTSAHFSPDGKSIVSASYDHSVRVWKYDNDGGLKRLIHGDTVVSASYSPDGRWIATAGTDPVVRVWDVTTGQLQHALAGHKGGMETVAFSPDSRLLVSGGLDRIARIWEVEYGQTILELAGHEGVLTHAEFSPDGRTIATSARDGTSRLWDVGTGKQMGAGPDLQGSRAQGCWEFV